MYKERVVREHSPFFVQIKENRDQKDYPPRKRNDTSIGDAINWEWIVQCSIDSGRDVIMVSRDSDYGLSYKDKWYVNDWLKQEIKERVSRRRNITLTGKLSEALKLVNVKVTKEMEEAEAEIIEQQIQPQVTQKIEM